MTPSSSIPYDSLERGGHIRLHKEECTYKQHVNTRDTNTEMEKWKVSCVTAMDEMPNRKNGDASHTRCQRLVPSTEDKASDNKAHTHQNVDESAAVAWACMDTTQKHEDNRAHLGHHNPPCGMSLHFPNC